MITYDYTPERVCSRTIHVELSDDATTIESVAFTGGCEGNLRAIGRLVAGQPVADVVSLLAGNDCKGRGTSCADQLTRALVAAQDAGASPRAGDATVADAEQTLA